MITRSIRTALAVALGACFVGFCTPSECAIIHVRTNGNDSNAGDSWEAAKQTVQAAVTSAASGDEIWVAAGTYQAETPDTKRIILKNQVALYGGFDGSETLRDQRKPDINKTVLDGQAYNGCVVYIASANPSAVVDGFTIRGGDRAPMTTSDGITLPVAGVYSNGTSVTVSNNVISNSRVGVYCNSLWTAILNNRITGCSSAGIACYVSVPLIANNVISGNASTLGAIYCYSNSTSQIAPVVITNNTIVGNSACGGAGAINVDGMLVTLTNNIIAFNSAGVSAKRVLPVMKSNCVYGNAEFEYFGFADPTGADGNISHDPVLAAWQYGEVHIQPGSPCVDAGDGSVLQPGWLDVDGQARLQGAGVDIGADESDGSVWSSEAPCVVRVSPDGDDANDGSSWNSAKRGVQAALDLAAMTGGEVWVAGGTYNERVTLPPFVHLYGGFSGQELSRAERDWAANRTVIDAQGHGTVVSAYRGHGVSRIDGFTIRGGAVDSETGASQGGGIVCAGASPTIANNVITLNSGMDGGGILCSQSFATIINNVIQGNYAERGGGVYCGTPMIVPSDSAPTLVNNTITGNAAVSGGGVYSELVNPVITNNIVAFNSSGVGVSGGSPVLKSNCVFGNTDSNYAGIDDPTGSNGNKCEDPLLAAWNYGNVRIQPGSPCVDAGDGSVIEAGWFDLDGQPRVQGVSVDIGADESNGQTQAVGAPVIIRVGTNGNDANDGSSWNVPKRTVQAAIDVAAVTGGDVWIEEGTYNERITLPGYVYLYGGFLRTGGDMATRSASLTVLDGGQGGSVVTALAGPGTVDGFTITNGSGTRLFGATCGGGLYATSPLFAPRDCIITHNTASRGAGVYGQSATTYCLVNYNTASEVGGGFYACGAFAKVAANAISDNSASKGGGVAGDCRVIGSPITGNTALLDAGGVFGAADVRDCIISDNTATRDGGGLASCLNVENCTISGNEAGNNGGGVLLNCSSASIKRCTITGNTAKSDNSTNLLTKGGGGLYCRAYSDISGNRIVGNTATSAGGGIAFAISNSSPRSVNVTRNTIEGNTAAMGGGVSVSAVSHGPWLFGNRITSNNAQKGGGVVSGGPIVPVIGNVIDKNIATEGGGAAVLSGEMVLVNNTMASNRATTGSAVYAVVGSGWATTAYATLVNNIIAFHSAALHFPYWYFEPVGNYMYNPEDYIGPDMLPDPQFVDRDRGDYHLRRTSPCIDAGANAEDRLMPEAMYCVPTRDMDGQKRAQGVRVDIGADEWWPGPGDVRKSPDGQAVELSGLAVSAAFEGAFYVEGNDRASGIRVEKAEHGLSEGVRVDVAGVMATNADGERCIAASEAGAYGSGTVAPLAIGNRSVGGGDSEGQMGVWALASTGDWARICGLNNIGLLITTWGRYTRTGERTFTVNDGSGVAVSCEVPEGVELSDTWQYVRVTGISSCEKLSGTGQDTLRSVIRVRSADDVVPCVP